MKLAVYTLPVQASSRAALSPGRKYLAVETSGGLELYRPLDGELVGRPDLMGSRTSLTLADGMAGAGMQEVMFDADPAYRPPSVVLPDRWRRAGRRLRRP